MLHLRGGHADDIARHALQPRRQFIARFRLGPQSVGEPAQRIDGPSERHGVGISPQHVYPLRRIVVETIMEPLPSCVTRQMIRQSRSPTTNVR